VTKIEKLAPLATAPTTFSVKLSPDLYHALADLAAHEDLRISDLVTRLVNAGLDYYAFQVRVRSTPSVEE
jgi:hypothetical protein